jgi:hypothetical protein
VETGKTTTSSPPPLDSGLILDNEGTAMNNH